MTVIVKSPGTPNVAPAPVPDEPVLLHGISWKTYELLLHDADASGRHVSITYQQGRMTVDYSRYLEGISWKTYESLLHDVEAVGQHLKITYHLGKMTIMSPLPVHERWKSTMGWMVQFMAFDLDIPIYSLGSTTWRRKGAGAGLEPDECFYVQHEPHVRGRLDLDLDHDPPPDLAIEVEVTHHPIARHAIYSGLRVPELWQYDGRQLTCLLLGGDGQYHAATNSLAFPFLRPADLARFIQMLPAHSEMEMKRAFRDWVRGDLASAARDRRE